MNLNDSADISNPECSFCDTLNAKHPPAQPLQRKCFYHQWILLQSTQLCLMPWMLQWFMLLLSVQWVLLNHFELILVDSKDCAPPFLQFLMNFVVQFLCLPGDCILHCFLQIFPLHFWDVISLLWTNLCECGLLEFVRWCNALW